MWLFVPFRLGEHQLGCGLYDPSGDLVWTDREVGPHPRLAAVVDLNGDGEPELVVDNHGMQYHYDLTGERRMVAHVWGSTIPGRGDGCAHALPIAGPFGPDDGLRVVMTPGYTALEVQGPDGERVAQRAFAHPPRPPKQRVVGGMAAGKLQRVGQKRVTRAVDPHQKRQIHPRNPRDRFQPVGIDMPDEPIGAIEIGGIERRGRHAFERGGDPRQ